MAKKTSPQAVTLHHVLADDSLSGAPLNSRRIANLLLDNYNSEFWCLKLKSDGLRESLVAGGFTVHGRAIINLIFRMVCIRIMGQINKNVFVLNGRGAGVLLRPILVILRLHFIYVYRGFSAARYRGAISSLKNWLLLSFERIFGRFGVCITVGEAEYVAVKKQVKPKRLYLVYNPIESVNAVFGEKDIDVALIGRKSFQKGYDKFLEIFGNQKTDLTVVWYGGSGDLSHARFNGVPSNVYIGNATDDVPSLLVRSRLLCVLSRWEGASTVVIEALMQGVPVVTLDCPGVTEFVLATGGGEVVNERRILKRCEAILGDVTLERKYQEAALGIRKIVNAQRSASQYVEIIESMSIHAES